MVEKSKYYFCINFILLLVSEGFWGKVFFFHLGKLVISSVISNVNYKQYSQFWNKTIHFWSIRACY